ncbi:hypothetical protein [Arthrobacter sp. ZGTC212]|uniref:hypothetical protein n=1 Tax=Arthrobacter sp. ZGTC212 TaxID=2058899 RepID=UPI000CE5606F|nr:hypothetical protein [Arthrobacter sp. ZGTC212]
MQITTAKLAGIAAAVALVAGAAGGVAGASLAGDSTPDVIETPQPTVSAMAPTLPAEVQDAPEAPAEVVQQIEANVTVNDVDITDARVYTVADIDVVVAVVSSVDVDVNAVGIWTMENNVIVGAANAPAAETTDFEQVDPPSEVAEVAAEAEVPVGAVPAAGGDRVPAAQAVPPEVVEGIIRLNWEGDDPSLYFEDPVTAGMVVAEGRYYVALSFRVQDYESNEHSHGVGVWVGDALDRKSLVPANNATRRFTPTVPQATDADPDAVSAAMRTVGWGWDRGRN